MAAGSRAPALILGAGCAPPACVAAATTAAVSEMCRESLTGEQRRC